MISNLDVERFKEPIQTEPFTEANHFEECSRLIGLGINLEKEGMIDEAINVYEKSIVPQLPENTHTKDWLFCIENVKIM